MAASKTASFGKRTAVAATPVRALPRVPVVADPAPKAPLGLASRVAARVPWFTLVLSYILCARFNATLQRATDFIAPNTPGHFSLLAMGAVDRTQVLGHGEWWRLFTATNLHGSPEHLIGNLTTFVLVGFLLEPMIGIGWFAAIYFTGGFCGAVLSMLLNGPDMLSVGASGAIMATLAALFTLSFHAGARRVNLMRRVALGSLIPALAPSLAHGGAAIDVNAHLGGCMAGIVIGFIMLIAWNDEQEEPPFRAIAALVAGLWVALTVSAFAMSANTFAGYAKSGLDYIPPKDIPRDIEAMKADSYALIAHYPRDPRSHLFRGLYFLEQHDASDAEPYFRDAIRLGEDSPAMPPDMLVWSKALLALTLRAQHRPEEAKILSAPLCADPGALDLRTRQTLEITKLCTQ